MFRWPLARAARFTEAPSTEAAETPAVGTSGWRVAAAAVLLAAAFYAVDHDFNTSLKDAYASTEEEMAQMSEGGNTLRRLAFLSIAGLGLLGLVQSPERRFPMGLLGFAMFAVVGWCALSWFWSIDPEMTSRRWLVLACAFLGALGLGRSFTARDLCFVGLIVGCASLGWGLFAEVRLGTFHPWTSDYRFAGTLHPNTQGLYLAVLTISAFCLARSEERMRPLYWTLLVVGLAALVLTKSRTSTGGTLLALGAIWSLQASWQVRVAGALGVVGIVLAGLFVVLVSGVDLEEELHQAALLGRQEQSESLTGRLPIWLELTHFVGESPWLGHGYDTFWTPGNIDTLADRIEWPIKEAHNGYLDQTLHIGLVGAGLILLCGVLGMIHGAQRYHETGNFATGIYVGLLAFGFLNCLTESGMLMPQFPAFLTACGLARLAFTEPTSDGSRA